MTHISEPVEFWSELDDLPAAVIEFANGKSPAELLDSHSDEDISGHEIERERGLARRNLLLLTRGKTNEVGIETVKALSQGNIAWKSHYDWNNGLRLRKEGILGRTTFSLGVTYATARLADLVAREQKVFLQCKGCKDFALLDRRGGGGRNRQRWCSTRCRNLDAQRRRREREKHAK